MLDLSCLTRDQIRVRCSGSTDPNHWITKEFPLLTILKKDVFVLQMKGNPEHSRISKDSRGLMSLSLDTL